MKWNIRRYIVFRIIEILISVAGMMKHIKG
jgi:hypothetical protein